LLYICARVLSLESYTVSSVNPRTRAKTAFGGRFPALFALLCAAALGGCVYKVDILQGNHLDERAIEQVQVGMTRSQVRFILGTPMIKDPFHADRWDYVYYFKKGGAGDAERKRLVVYFENDAVLRLDRDAPLGEPGDG